MITLTDAQRDNILHQTSGLVKSADLLHNTFAASPNISDKALEEWHNTLYQASAILDNIEAQVRRIESKNQ